MERATGFPVAGRRNPERFAGTVENTLSKVTVSGAAKQEFSGIFNAALLEVSGTATAIFKKVPALTVTATTAKIAPSAGSVMEVTGALTLPGSSTVVPIDFTGITVSSDFVPLLRTSVAGLTCSTALPEGTMWVDVPEGATHIYGLLPTANVYTATVSTDCTWESLNWTYSGGSVTSASLPTTAVLQMNVTGTPTITVSAPAVKVVSMVLSAPVTFAYNGAIPATTFESVFPGRSVNYPLFNFPVTGAFSWTYSGASTPAGFEITGGEHLTIALSSWVRTSSINVSFYRDASIASQNLNSSDNANSNHGAFSIKGANWKDIKPLTMGATALKKVNADGTVTVDGSGTLAVANGNDAWRVHSEYAPQDNLLRGYIADFTNPTLTFANIPFAKFRVIVYFSAAEKSKSFNFVKINNVDYCGAADAVGGATIKGTSPWGKSTNGDTVLALKEGVNYLISDTLTSPTFTIAYTPSGSSALETGSGIAGIQIVEVTAEVKGIYTREAGSSGDWSAAKWTKDGTVSTVWTNATETVPTYATIDVVNAQSLALTTDVSATSVAVSGTGNLALTGTGALQTSFFDATKLNGTLTLGTTGLLTTVVDTGADATVALETTADRTYSSAFLLRGAGKFKKIGEGTATIAMPSCPIDLQAGGLTLTGAASSKVTSLAGTTLTVNGAMTVTAETQIAGKLIKNGSGDLLVKRVGRIADVTVSGGNLNIDDKSAATLGKVTMLGGTVLNVGSWYGTVTMNSLKLQDNATVAFANGNYTEGGGPIVATEGITIENGATFKGSRNGAHSVIRCGSGKTISGTGTLTLTKNDNSDCYWTIAAPIAGELKVVKMGALARENVPFVVVLTDVGTYTGGTEVTEGTLTAKASSIGPGNVTVASGATLEISDRATNKLTIHAGKTLAGAGTITGNVSFADTAILNASTVLTVNGTLTLPTVGTVAVTLPTPSTESTYLIKCNGATAADALKFSCTNLPAGLAVAPVTTGTQGYKLVAVVAPPKPNNAGESDTTSYTSEAIRTLQAIAAANGLSAPTVTAKTATGSASGKLLSAAAASDALGCFSNIASASGTTIAIVYDFGISALAPTETGLNVTAKVQGVSGTSATFAQGVEVELFAAGNPLSVPAKAIAAGTESELVISLDANQKADALNKVLTVKATKPTA
ncbi:MAG: hypothetical protein RSB14_06925, partial [Kiritimatiellia bacterium]